MILKSAQRNELALAKKAVLRAFGKDPNVTAFGYGFRRRGGRLTDEPAVIASVARKRPPGYLSRGRMLPKTVEVGGRRYGVDVVQAGPFSLAGGALPAAAGRGVSDPISDRFRPARQGCVLVNRGTGEQATFGCLVRDTGSGNTVILTSGHGLGSLAGARPGDRIAQPEDDDDVIGTLLRYNALGKDRVNPTSAALVSVQEKDVDTLVARNLMTPIQQKHPILGIHIANGSDGSSLFARIRPTMREMGVDFWGNESSLICDAIDFNMNVDKVGSHTGYTSSVVVGMGVTPVGLSHLGDSDYLVFDDLVQVDMGFALWRDRGAVVCLGGDGQTRAPLQPFPCRMLTGAEEVTGLPFAGDEELADKFRDGFLGQSKTGRMLTRAFYVNYEELAGRYDQMELTPTEKDHLGALYDRYRQIAQGALSTPNSPGYVVTTEHIADASNALYYLTVEMRPSWLSVEELNAAWELLEIFQRTEGMNRAQLTAMLNDDAVYREVHGILAAVPSIKHLGPLGADE
ncbi:hypothetical protein [Actinomadura sp. B10D3]|uniref:hypothetical protein n=1 Tax=Actinomadura sp. B10D3 TaxID=3153557 RepID=UPI00325EC9F2